MAPGPGRVAEAGLAPGALIGHYEILGQLGCGGMGEVYLARDRRLGRQVALKRPYPEQALQPKFRQRFLHEARAASAIDHPNVVTIFEVDEDHGVPWIAMELVRGRTLRQILADGRLFSMEETLRHGAGLAGALEAAHDKGILHRDINPNNVMITDDGRAMLADFGLARVWAAPGKESGAVTRSARLTRAGVVCGTPGYMSPEQAQGREVDPRSDVYALALVLQEMCTGRRPEEAPDATDLAAVIRRRESGSMPRLSQEVPTDLERVLRRALAQRPDDRHPSAAELRRELDDLHRRCELGAFEQHHPHPPDPRTVRQYWAGYLLLSLLLLALLAGWGYERWFGAPPLPRWVEEQATTSIGWEAEPALSPDGGLLAYAALHEDHSDIWLLDRVGRSNRAFRLTEEGAANRQPEWLPDGTALLYVSSRDGRDDVWRLPRLGGAPALVVPDAVNPAVSRDGSRIAFARLGRDGSGLRIFVAPLGDPAAAVQLTDADDGLWDHVAPAWSPDGRSICYADFRNLWVIPAAGGTPRQLTDANGSDQQPVWSPDGRFVYFASYRGQNNLAIWRVPAQGGEAERLTTGSGEAAEPTLSADGRLLAYSTAHSRPDLVYVDLGTGARVVIRDARADTSPALAPDGSGAVFSSDRVGGRFDLWFQPLVGGKPVGEVRRITDHPGAVSHPTYSPDSRWIAYQRVVNEERDIWVVPATGGTGAAFTAEPGPDIHPAWSPDGRRIAFVSERAGRSHLWVAPVKEGRPDGPAVRITDDPATTDLFPVWSPDGMELAYVCGTDGVAEVCVAPVDRRAAPRRLTRNAGVRRVRWERSTGILYAAGHWGEDLVTLRSLPLDGGASVPFEPPIVFGRGEPYGDFDVDGRSGVLVFTLEERQGDLWVLTATERTF